MTAPRRAGHWGWGLLFAAALLAVYVAAWRPLRAAFAEHVAYGVLSSIRTERAQRFQLDRTSVPRTVVVRAAEGEEASPPAPVAFTAPMGFFFLVPALFLVGLFPFRLYWAYYGLGHLALGLLELAAVSLGVGWSAWGFEGYKFLHGYAVVALSLAVLPAVLVWYRGGPQPANSAEGGA